MAQKRLIGVETAVAARQPKTDRLMLARYLRDAGDDQKLDEERVTEAHTVLVKWADLETSGRLAKFKETQLQGDFLGEVFGHALEYTLWVDNAPAWHLIQHETKDRDTPDAILGQFELDHPRDPLAVIELKGPKVHLDRDRSNGRTAVDQCWDYLVNTPPACRWGIVSNVVSFRLYERDSTKRRYEHFTLQSLRDLKTFRQFYAIFRRKGLIEATAGAPPRAIELLQKSTSVQREVGDKLYDEYSKHRIRFVEHLHRELGHPVGKAIEYAQRLLDRVIFIAFCEDRGLLPPKTIESAYKELPAFTRITNPRWQNFKTLFQFVNEGGPEIADEPNGRIPAYNGGLFKVTDADDLELDDQWTTFFNRIASYDFADEVNLDVLGHLFERSITELEKLKETGMFGGESAAVQEYAAMPQSAKRKRLGIYYTPAELTSRIVDYTVDELIAERFAALAGEFGVAKPQAARGVMPDDEAFWRRCLDILRDLKIVDPACGSGAFLFQAYNVLEHRYLEVIGHLEKCGADDAVDLAESVPRMILEQNLYGVDLSPEAVEITQLALWIRSATPGQTLATLSRNIVHGNSLVHDPEVHAAGFVWQERFPEVYRPSVSPDEQHSRGVSPDEQHSRGVSPGTTREPGFDCVIGNPPWERIKLQEREFFSLPAPEIATATNAAKRRQLVAKLESDDPALYERYQESLASANALLTYCRKSDAYPLTGKGDINLYAVFAELAYKLVAPYGRVGLLTPSGIASDKTTKDFFAAVAESNRLIRLFDFENKRVFFPDVHASFKFCILNFGGEAVATDAAQFVFFVHKVEELEDPKRLIALSGDDIKLLNPNTRTCPIFRTNRDAEITKAIYRRVPILIDRNREGPTGNPWGIKFNTMFHQTNDAELFREEKTLKAAGFKLRRNRWEKGKQVFLPVYEAKMLQMYDHRAADVVTDDANWVRQGQTAAMSLVDHQNPEHLAMPRFWVESGAVAAKVTVTPSAFLCFKDVTSPTNQRTMIAAMTPFAGIVNSAPITVTAQNCSRTCCLLGNLNSPAYDYVMRQKISNVHLNFFIVEQIPTFPPDTYDKPCPWDRETTLETWVSERVLKLTCTAEDMLPLAEACDFTSGSFQKEYDGRLNKWDEQERAQLMAELDAAYFHLYGINREDAEYILSTFKGIHSRSDLLPGPRTTAEYILAKYDELGGAAG
jgi:hypothetical protein